MLSLLYLFSKQVLGQIFERSDLAELVLVLRKSRQIAHFILRVIPNIELKHLEVVVKTVSSDYFTIFEYFMTNLFCLSELDRAILSLQVPRVHSTHPASEISDALFRNHIFVNQHVAIIVHN